MRRKTIKANTAWYYRIASEIEIWKAYFGFHFQFTKNKTWNSRSNEFQRFDFQVWLRIKERFWLSFSFSEFGLSGILLWGHRYRNWTDRGDWRVIKEVEKFER